MIAIGCDHGGYELKNTIKAHLESRGFEVYDVGTNSADS
jgi:ribose 5-phosphate isomerase B